MVEFVENLYQQSGAWGDPIVIAIAVLFVMGWIMMFTVRLVKRFVLFIIIALVLPNGIGLMGYLDEADTLHEAIVEQGEAMQEEAVEAIEGLEFSPLYLSLIGSVVVAAVGVGGLLRVRRTGGGTS